MRGRSPDLTAHYSDEEIIEVVRTTTTGVWMVTNLEPKTEVTRSPQIGRHLAVIGLVNCAKSAPRVTDVIWLNGSAHIVCRRMATIGKYHYASWRCVYRRCCDPRTIMETKV